MPDIFFAHYSIRNFSINLIIQEARAKPMEPALISGFCNDKRMRVFDSPGQDTNPSQVSSQQTLVFIYLPRKDGKPSWLRRKRRPHKDLNLGKVPGSNWGPRGWKAEILPTAPTTSGKPPLIINQ